MNSPRSSLCFTVSWQGLHSVCRFRSSQNNCSSPLCGSTWSQMSFDVLPSTLLHIWQVKWLRVNVAMRSFFQRGVLYHLRYGSLVYRCLLRSCSSFGIRPMRGGSVETKGLRVVSLAICHQPLRECFVPCIFQNRHNCLTYRRVVSRYTDRREEASTEPTEPTPGT
jgi:hypothetical protein